MNNITGAARGRAGRARAALLLAACALLPGCTFIRAIFGRGPRPPALELYRLSVPDATPRDSPVASAPLPGIIAIAPYVAPGLYGGRSIVFRQGDTFYGAYPSTEWAIPLAEQLGLLTERVINRQPLSSDGALFDPPSLRSQPYIWRGTVRQFEEVDRVDSTVFAVVELDAQLVRTSNDSVLWSGNAKRERQVPSPSRHVPPSMTAVVETLSELAEETVTELVAAARVAVARSGASTARVQE